MIDKDKFEQYLEEAASELPEEFFWDLNGGISISDEAPLHEASVADDYYIMGQYYHDPILGRGITIFYGSFEKVFGNASDRFLRSELKKTLRHEFRHHIEGLAGEDALAVEDEEELEEYLEDHQKPRSLKRRRRRLVREKKRTFQNGDS